MEPKKEIQQELKELDSPLAGLPRAMPYAVPKGYFEDLASSGLQAAKSIEVPANYFQNLPKAMLAAVKAAEASNKIAKPKARIISLRPARQWAAAAVLLISFGIGGALLFDAQNATPEKAITSLPADAIQEYMAANPDEADDVLVLSDGASELPPVLTGLSEEELEAYLSEEGLLF